MYLSPYLQRKYRYFQRLFARHGSRIVKKPGLDLFGVCPIGEAPKDDDSTWWGNFYALIDRAEELEAMENVQSACI